MAKYPGNAEPNAEVESVLNFVDTEEDGRRRVPEMMQAAMAKHGARLTCVELQQIGEDGEWAALGRFYPQEYK